MTLWPLVLFLQNFPLRRFLKISGLLKADSESRLKANELGNFLHFIIQIRRVFDLPHAHIVL
jgi:hypothetical protein